MCHTFSPINIYAGLLLLIVGMTAATAAEIENGQKLLLGKGIELILEAAFESSSPDVVATAIRLTLEPGDQGYPPHTHPGPLIGYVIEGEFLYQTNAVPPRIIKAGNGFHENDGEIHIWGGNASNSTVCKIFAVVLGRRGEPILTFVKDYPLIGYEATLALAEKNEI